MLETPALRLNSFGSESRVLIQGASRGIGLAMVHALLHHSDAQIFATSRNPEASAALTGLARDFAPRLTTYALDLGDTATIARTAAALAARDIVLDVVINVSGLLHDGKLAPEKRLEDIEAETLLRSLTVNAVGPMLVIKHVFPLLASKQRCVIANLSARVGSISDNRLGGWYSYRASKAAQNMLTKTMAVELARRRPLGACVALHPGTVDTDLSKPFQSRHRQRVLFAAETSATYLLNIIDALSAADNGRFIAYDGSDIPW